MLEIKPQVWYRSVKVPVRPYNKALGLDDIKVFPANAKQKEFGIVCNCILHLISGTVRITIAESKHQPGMLYLVTPGQEKMLVKGQVQYYENVQLKYELKAQVLKYIESLVEQA
ncbi:hypothetical protein ABWK22_02800 [Gottfriedia acidiceleris]|uniref:hypothetical protein n=1 Tax=Gottfriedia acidiceleris TaxID=371036 RepID=UPI0033975CD3